MQRKTAELKSHAGDNEETVFNEDVCKGHFDAHRARLNGALGPSAARDGGAAVSRILLGHSYFLRFDPKLWRARQPYPPPWHPLRRLYAARARPRGPLL